MTRSKDLTETNAPGARVGVGDGEVVRLLATAVRVLTHSGNGIHEVRRPRNPAIVTPDLGTVELSRGASLTNESVPFTQVEAKLELFRHLGEVWLEVTVLQEGGQRQPGRAYLIGFTGLNCHVGDGGLLD